MNKKEMILTLIEHYSNGNKAQFARLLGITPQGLSTWISRETFDIELIYAKCEDVSPEWLLTGKGEMRKTKRISGGVCADGEHAPESDNTNKDKQIIPEKQENTAIISQLLDTIREQAEEIGQLKALIAELERRIRAAEDTHTTAAAG